MQTQQRKMMSFHWHQEHETVESTGAVGGAGAAGADVGGVARGLRSQQLWGCPVPCRDGGVTGSNHPE